MFIDFRHFRRKCSWNLYIYPSSIGELARECGATAMGIKTNFQSQAVVDSSPTRNRNFSLNMLESEEQLQVLIERKKLSYRL